MPNLNQKRDLPASQTKTIAAAISAAVAGTGTVAQGQDHVMLEEVIVTATKREASMQDIAQSIQAIGNEAIERQGLYSLEDYARFVPSMTYLQSGTQSKLIFRGLGDAPDTFIAQPSASIYLDEQPLTARQTQPNPRLVDIERLEALSGPQGTLYGDSSQSGTLRIITNKPNPNGFESFIDLAARHSEEGDPSYDVSGMVNIPLIENKLAIRLVGFAAREGGFVDNVLGTTPICASSLGEDLGFGSDGFCSGRDNSNVVQDDYNESDTIGGRISARWFANEDWQVTAGITLQDLDSAGSAEYDKTVGDLEAIRFFEDDYDDEWQQYSLTIEGDLGWANLVSATSYFTRDLHYFQDTTGYLAYFGSFCSYGTVSYNVYCFQPAGAYYYQQDTIGYREQFQEIKRFTQEFRLSGGGEKIEWIAGVFYEDASDDWDFDSIAEGYGGSQGFANWIEYWGIDSEPTDGWWFSTSRTDFEQTAVFGELTYHINEDWSVTVGGRWFDRTSKELYWSELPAGRRTPASVDKHLCTDGQGAAGADCNGGVAPSGDNGFTFPDGGVKDFVPKFSVKYNIDDDKMVYALYSEGFRPGGSNRARGNPFYPTKYDADFLKNVELGAKTRWADGRLQINATLFSMTWEDYQLEVIDPSNIGCDNPGALAEPDCGQPWQKVITNLGDASSEGAELSITALPTERLELSLNLTYLKAETDDDLCTLRDGDDVCVQGLDVPSGSTLPYAPELKGSLFAQYTWPTELFGAREAYVQFQWSYQDDSFNQVEDVPIPFGPTDYGNNAPQVTQEGFDVADLKIGLVGNTWEANLSVRNIGDERGQIFHNTGQFDWFWGGSRTSTIRPREFGVRFIKRWE